jgi:hypothetical protein
MSLTTIIWIIAIILVVGVAFYLIKSKKDNGSGSVEPPSSSMPPTTPSEPPMSPPEGPPAM